MVFKSALEELATLTTGYGRPGPYLYNVHERISGDFLHKIPYKYHIYTHIYVCVCVCVAMANTHTWAALACSSAAVLLSPLRWLLRCSNLSIIVSKRRVWVTSTSVQILIKSIIVSKRRVWVTSTSVQILIKSIIVSKRRL